ncbi:MAG: dienelactone hydrolase family protein [Bacteroidales bacterium]|nr:dienelactone hydrolase family protein [Bacteroidales bacterium]
MDQLKQILYAIFILMVTISCGNQSNKNLDNTTQQTNNQITTAVFKAGNIYKQIPCSNNASESYALYLPKSYSDSSSYPVIYFFDSHGRGYLPINRYQDLADQFGWIIACSNNSKNGLNYNDIRQTAFNFIQDVKSRFKVNTQAQYTCGFSGGARVAVRIAMEDKEIQGVAGFGAGLPDTKIVNQIDFKYFIACGIDDFNFAELAELHNELTDKNKDHNFVVFDSTHFWPDSNTMKSAFYYFSLKNKVLQTDSLVEDYRSFENANLNMKKNQNDIPAQVAIYKRMINNLNEITNTIDIEKKIGILTKTKQYADYQSKIAKTLTDEKDYRSFATDMMTYGDTEYWNQELANLDEKMAVAKDSVLKHSFRRIRGYLGLMAYIFTNNSLESNTLASAQKHLFIYEKLEPKNPEMHYFKALFYARQNNHHLALLSMEEAVKNGFNDLERIRKENAFQFSEIELDIIRKEMIFE